MNSSSYVDFSFFLKYYGQLWRHTFLAPLWWRCHCSHSCFELHHTVSRTLNSVEMDTVLRALSDSKLSNIFYLSQRMKILKAALKWTQRSRLTLVRNSQMAKYLKSRSMSFEYHTRNIVEEDENVAMCLFYTYELIRILQRFATFVRSQTYEYWCRSLLNFAKLI